MKCSYQLGGAISVPRSFICIMQDCLPICEGVTIATVSYINFCTKGKKKKLHTRTRACVYIHMQACACVSLRACVCAHVSVYACVCACLLVCVCLSASVCLNSLGWQPTMDKQDQLSPANGQVRFENCTAVPVWLTHSGSGALSVPTFPLWEQPVWQPTLAFTFFHSQEARLEMR